MTRTILRKRSTIVWLSMASFAVLAASPGESKALFVPSGEIGFCCGTYTPVGGADLATATGLAFPAPALVPAATGSFTLFSGLSASFLAFDFAPPSPAGTPIVSITGPGTTVVFEASSITIDFQTPTALDLTMLGNWTGVDVQVTPGFLNLTADALNGIFVYSATGGTRVPEPSSIALWIMGVAGLGLAGLRRRSQIR